MSILLYVAYLPGYADLENPVFFRETTQMLLGDGKSSCEGIAAALKAKG